MPSLQLAAFNGYRLPLGAGSLKETLREIRPDVVTIHDPFWRPLSVTREAHRLGAAVVAVHHASPALNAAGIPGPDAIYLPTLRRIYHHAYEHVDAVIVLDHERAELNQPPEPEAASPRLDPPAGGSVADVDQRTAPVGHVHRRGEGRSAVRSMPVAASPVRDRRSTIAQLAESLDRASFELAFRIVPLDWWTTRLPDRPATGGNQGT